MDALPDEWDESSRPTAVFDVAGELSAQEHLLGLDPPAVGIADDPTTATTSGLREVSAKPSQIRFDPRYPGCRT